MITKKELLEKLYVDGSFAECWNNLKKWAESLPDDELATIPFQYPVPDGYEVVTRDGRKVEQLHRFEAELPFPIFGFIKENNVIYTWKNKGEFSHEPSDLDIFLRLIEKKIWVVERKDDTGLLVRVACESLDEAKNWRDKFALGSTIYEAILKPVKAG